MNTSHVRREKPMPVRVWNMADGCILLVDAFEGPMPQTRFVLQKACLLYTSGKDNMIVLPKGKLAVIDGLEGYLIAESDNVLLICRKEDVYKRQR